jgi:hypothetical protein
MGGMNHIAALVLRLAAEAALARSRVWRQGNPQMLMLMFILRDAANEYEAA